MTERYYTSAKVEVLQNIDLSSKVKQILLKFPLRRPDGMGTGVLQFFYYLCDSVFLVSFPSTFSYVSEEVPFFTRYL